MNNILTNSIIYQVYTRNFSTEGTFKQVIDKLDYLKELKVDIIYLLPINPIGKNNRKGKLGSPYSISDYMKINPELGKLKDLKKLIKLAYKKDMKVMIDIVFNHTSRDSKILNKHPEWMYHDKNGNFANKAGDWSDVYDLDLTNKNLIKYLTNVIRHYCKLGIDGFRFDVVSCLSKRLIESIIKMLNKEYPKTILLGEAVEISFLEYLKEHNLNMLTDADLYSLGFDMLYTYSTFTYLKQYLLTKDLTYLNYYKAVLKQEDLINITNNLRIRGIENHDNLRLIEYTKDRDLMENLASFHIFLKGPMFIYNGLETKADHVLNLFDKDLLDMSIDESWFKFINRLIEFKKEDFNQNILYSNVVLTNDASLIIINTYNDFSKFIGLFNLSEEEITIKNPELMDGKYINYINNKEYEIKNNSIKIRKPLFLYQK